MSTAQSGLYRYQPLYLPGSSPWRGCRAARVDNPDDADFRRMFHSDAITAPDVAAQSPFAAAAAPRPTRISERDGTTLDDSD